MSLDENAENNLKRSHHYYHQVQGQSVVGSGVTS